MTIHPTDRLTMKAQHQRFGNRLKVNFTHFVAGAGTAELLRVVEHSSARTKRISGYRDRYLFYSETFP
jgi:hypothetical protein